jgi:uncharacterized protein (UPF0276 family)
VSPAGFASTATVGTAPPRGKGSARDLERDDDFPPEAEVVAELGAIADAARLGGEHRVRG